MAREDGSTIREMIQGFNSMQSQLGLLPPQTGQMPMGVSLNPPPPPPLLAHPGDISARAVQQHQAAQQYTMGMAQQLRMPSASPMSGMSPDVTWGRTLGQINQQQFNPYVANAIGGGGLGIPSPIYNTSATYGMYRPQMQHAAPPYMSPIPSFFNPMPATMSGPRFQTPADRSFATMQAYQNQGSAFIASGMHAGVQMGGGMIGGSMLGAALGSAFGPLGTIAGGFAGSWLGEKVGGAVGNMMTGPVTNDLASAGRIRGMSAPWVSGGANFDSITGQGVSRQSALRTAVRVRELSRDHDLNRQTGYNAADMQKLTELAADHNLINLGENADQISRAMRNVSKAIKAVVQITGDPDVRNAMGELGKMKNLGFQGVTGQMGAVANQSMFAHMAGVSYSGAGETYGMPGAMTAQSIGLAGRTGYMAGVASGGMATVAHNAGSFDDLQLARAGGRQGVAQTLMNAALGAQNQDLYMAASLRKGSDGRLYADTDAFKKSQRMDIGDVSREAAQRLHDLGPEGISQLSTRRQEFKDRIAASMSPMEMQLNVLRQALAMRDKTGLNLGGALKVMTGGDEQVARTLEQTFTNPEFYNQMGQQLEGQRRQVIDRGRTNRAQYRTPGTVTRIGRGMADFGYGASDAITSPLRSLTDWFDERVEDRSITAAGGKVTRLRGSEVMRDESDLRSSINAMRNTSTQIGTEGGGSTSNLLWSEYGFGRADSGTRNRQIALQMMGREALVGAFVGPNSNQANGMVSEAVRSSQAMSRTRSLDAAADTAFHKNLDSQLGGKNSDFLVRQIVGSMDKDWWHQGGVGRDATGVTVSSVAEMAKKFGAGDLGAGAQEALFGAVSQHVDRFGTQSLKERFNVTRDSGSRAVSPNTDASEARKSISEGFSALGYKTVGTRMSKVAQDVEEEVKQLMSRFSAEAFHYEAMRLAGKQLPNVDPAVSREAAELHAMASPAAEEAIKRIGQNATGATLGNIAGLKATLQSTKGVIAAQSGIQKLGETLGIDELKGVGGSMDSAKFETVLARLSQKGTDISKASSGIQKAVGLYQSGKKKEAIEAARESFVREGGGGETRAAFSGAGEDGMDSLNADIASLAAIQKDVGAGSGGKKEEYAAQKVFTDSVQVFAKSVDKLARATDTQSLTNLQLDQYDPNG